MEKKNTKKASVLAFTLIMLSILLLAGLSLMGSVTVDQRASIDTRKSVQALQSAESGSDVMVSKIKKNMSGTIENLGPGNCSGGVISGSSSQGTYAVSFLDKDDDSLDCGDNVKDIAKVASTGTYAQTNRAVEVSLAAGYKTVNYGNCEHKTLSFNHSGSSEKESPVESCPVGSRAVDHTLTSITTGIGVPPLPKPEFTFKPNGGDDFILVHQSNGVTGYNSAATLSVTCCELVNVGS
jgi:hypothetical protein